VCTGRVTDDRRIPLIVEHALAILTLGVDRRAIVVGARLALLTGTSALERVAVGRTGLTLGVADARRVGVGRAVGALTLAGLADGARRAVGAKVVGPRHARHLHHAEEGGIGADCGAVVLAVAPAQRVNASAQREGDRLEAVQVLEIAALERAVHIEEEAVKVELGTDAILEAHLALAHHGHVELEHARLVVADRTRVRLVVGGAPAALRVLGEPVAVLIHAVGAHMQVLGQRLPALLAKAASDREGARGTLGTGPFAQWQIAALFAGHVAGESGHGRGCWGAAPAGARLLAQHVDELPRVGGRIAGGIVRLVVADGALARHRQAVSCVVGRVHEQLQGEGLRGGGL